MSLDLIYVKECLGQNRKPIDIYKIRTMREDAEIDYRRIAYLNGLDSLGKIRDDPRLTNIGRFLRRYWIDEFPQIYNLAKGDIKLVGIRPMSEEDWTDYPVTIMKSSLRQKPGLVGINYAFAPSDRFEDKFDHMHDYLEQWEIDPVGTDRRFLNDVIKNIVFRGIRSS